VLPLVVGVVFVLFVPTMIVLDAAAGAFPITGKVARSIVMRRYPVGSGIRRPAPIPGMPSPLVPHRIPIAIDPKKVGAGSHRPHSNYARRRRRPDLDSDGYLSEGQANAQQQQGKKFLPHAPSFSKILA
jgi:hypothetical protein